MLITPSRLLLAMIAAGALAMMPAAGLAQEPSSTQGNAQSSGNNTNAGGSATTNTGQKNWKDRAEYDLYDSITKDTNPQTRLQKLNEWKQKYGESQFADVRRDLFLTTYAALNQVQNTLNMAKEILAADPNNFTALYYTTWLSPLLPGITGQAATPDQLAAAEHSANALLNGGLDKQFAPDKKPKTMSDADWHKARTDVEAIAHTTLGWVDMQQQKNEQAEAEFQKSLSLNPNNGQVAYWMGQVIVAEKKPERRPVAYYYFARAAAYDGQGSLAPAGRKQVQDYLTQAYTAYHGSKDGLDQLLAQAKNNPTPPANFTIVSAREIAEQKVQQENAFAQQHPELALWKNIKTELTGPNGQQYFDSSMKGALLPELKGKVVSISPATRPKTVVMALEDGTTPDATLTFETALPGKVDPGTELAFRGIPQSYTASPFMVTFAVDKKDLKGWPEPAPVRRRAPAHRSTRHK